MGAGLFRGWAQTQDGVTEQGLLGHATVLDGTAPSASAPLPSPASGLLPSRGPRPARGDRLGPFQHSPSERR